MEQTLTETINEKCDTSPEDILKKKNKVCLPFSLFLTLCEHPISVFRKGSVTYEKRFIFPQQSEAFFISRASLQLFLTYGCFCYLKHFPLHAFCVLASSFCSRLCALSMLCISSTFAPHCYFLLLQLLSFAAIFLCTCFVYYYHYYFAILL